MAKGGESEQTNNSYIHTYSYQNRSMFETFFEFQKTKKNTNKFEFLFYLKINLNYGIVEPPYIHTYIHYEA